MATEGHNLRAYMKQITRPEWKSLRDMRPRDRQKWLLRRFGTQAERGRVYKGDYPDWVQSLVNKVNNQIAGE